MSKFCNNDENADVDIIFNFFKKFTENSKRPTLDMKIGFGIYYSQERRRKILSAILNGTSTTMTDEGKKILDTYKTQLDLQIKRIKADRKKMQ